MRKVVVQNLGMIVTEKCNLDCKHCLRGEKCNKNMSDDVIKATLSQISEIQNLCICGGEVTLAVDVIEKIFNYIIEHKIKVNEVSTIINGTVYSEVFLDALDNIEKYIASYRTTDSPYVLFTISDDKYHKEEIERLKLDSKFIQNVENYKKSIHFLGFQQLDPNMKLYREGTACELDEEITIPLKQIKTYMTFPRKKIFSKKIEFNMEKGICNIGPLVGINTEGIITELDSSNYNQRNKYYYGNVLNDSLYEVFLDRSQIISLEDWHTKTNLAVIYHKTYKK